MFKYIFYKTHHSSIIQQVVDDLFFSLKRKLKTYPRTTMEKNGQVVKLYYLLEKVNELIWIKTLKSLTHHLPKEDVDS